MEEDQDFSEEILKFEIIYTSEGATKVGVRTKMVAALDTRDLSIIRFVGHIPKGRAVDIHVVAVF